MKYNSFSSLRTINNRIKSLEEALNKERTDHLSTKREYKDTETMLEGVRQSFMHYTEQTDNEIQALKSEKTDLQEERQVLLLRY